MINQEKLKIYIKYDGDIDNWARTGSKKEKLNMADEDWYLLDSLLQDLALVKNGLTSSEFSNSLRAKLSESCDGEDTINKLQKIVDMT